MRLVLVVLALVFAVAVGAAGAQDVEVEATLETEPFFDNDENDADADDPAIWVHPQNRARSIVVGTLKNGGLAVFDRGSVGFARLDSLVLPSTFSLTGGGSWSPCTEEDGELPQVEGMVVDARRGFLFAAQEDVGIWRIPVGSGALAAPKLVDRVREFGQPYTRTFDPDEEEFVCEIDASAPSWGSEYLAADSEGLTIYPLPGNGRGYLLASSQGSSTFIVYDLASLKPLGTFAIGDGLTDAVDDSDGAMVVGLQLGAFTQGLLVTHDGDDEPNEDATNFKFTRWDDVAEPLGLTINTTTGDPRR